MIKKMLCVLTTTVTVCSFVVGSVLVQADSNSNFPSLDKEKLLKQDVILQKKIDKFWGKYANKNLEMFSFSEDGSVALRKQYQDNMNLKKFKIFEKDFTKLVEDVHESNEKKGVFKERKVDVTEDGGLAFGSSISCKCNTNTNNNFSFNNLRKGDILLQDCAGESIYGNLEHAGFFTGQNTTRSRSAQLSTRVLFEYIDYLKLHNHIYLARVKVNGNLIGKTRSGKAYDTIIPLAQIGEPYNFALPKNYTDSWYCSKIPWYGYKHNIDGSTIDIDATSDYTVTPNNIYDDNNIAILRDFYK